MTEQAPEIQTTPELCAVCHQPVLPEYYFCPNCGNRLHEPPLSTSPSTQTWVYIFSAILPMICFIAFRKWPGTKYFKSNDQKAKQIGTIAWVVLLLSTIVTIWLAYTITESMVQSSVKDLNIDMSE